MKKDNIHVFKRNMDTISIRMAVDHCEELATEDK